MFTLLPFEKPRLCSQNSIKANLPAEMRKETVTKRMEMYQRKDPGKNNLSVKENLRGTSGPRKFKEQNVGS